MKINRSFPLIALVLFLLLIACNRPFSTAPTPFSFPTPDLTLTAIFAVLNTPAAPPATATGVKPVVSTPVAPAATATSAPVIQPTNPPPAATNTSAPQPAATNTSAPPAATNTPPPPTNTAVPPAERSGGQVTANYVAEAPSIDGNLSEWGTLIYPAHSVVYGKGNWTGNADLGADFKAAWDYQYLYLAVAVDDDRHVQLAENAELYLGDSLEILLDTELTRDYYRDELSADDFQLGISPGSSNQGSNPHAYLWFPDRMSGRRSDVKISARWVAGGYWVEVAIPWKMFEFTPEAGKHYGFALSVSDNDKDGENVQQSMVSSASTRRLTNPTTWGDLYLKK